MFEYAIEVLTDNLQQIRKLMLNARLQKAVYDFDLAEKIETELLKAIEILKEGEK